MLHLRPPLHPFIPIFLDHASRYTSGLWREDTPSFRKILPSSNTLSKPPTTIRYRHQQDKRSVVMEPCRHREFHNELTYEDGSTLRCSSVAIRSVKLRRRVLW